MSRLNDANIKIALEIISHYPRPKSALIPLLHLAQEQSCYVTREAMVHLGELVGVTSAEVYGTATFYEMFRFEPVGKVVGTQAFDFFLRACVLQGLQHIGTPHLTRNLCRGLYLRLPQHVCVDCLCGRTVGGRHLAWLALLLAPHVAQGFQQLGWVLADEGRDVLQRVATQRVKPFAPIVLHQRELEFVGIF